ncbi:response regulator transcription factor [Seonamhaeicola maritimus]|uniref:Response regulator transcription factor n=1 Tax=Seonamhaeicola maritimus TaxID=2591822 RepID=A0A5C7GKP3_9FLAO|nr:response regulator transcription factor [Seonamhaeicola maritimus]TXG38840.1 response regulator transcription factor [Seonamhaeicola maritimus]
MELKKHILLVEDDKSMGFLLKDSLESYFYNVTHAPDGKSALEAFKNDHFDLCLLDVMMPNMDGFTLASEIRKTNVDVPIIFLTAKAMKEDRIKGFKLGADDYVTKPFSVEELVLRIKAILKRGFVLETTKKEISFLDYKIDLNNLSLTTSTNTIQLTQKEADILALFVTNKNALLKREYILKTIWKDDSYFVGRSLDVFISKLRKHFKQDLAISIVNIHGTGYKFEVLE